MMKITVAITGASGSILGIRLIEELDKKGVEVHTIVSSAAKEVMKHETDNVEVMIERIKKFSRAVYDEDDFSAPVSSGSFRTDGMVIAPCSMKTMADIAHGYSSNLIKRAADVCIKQKRTLVLMPRETPFSSIHLENMLKLSNTGAWIVPPVLGFYFRPKKTEDIVNHSIGKVMEIFNIEHDLYKKWGSENE